MARKDDLIKSFLGHQMLRDKYGITEEEMNYSHSTALDSNKPVIRSIAIVIGQVESSASISDGKLYEMIAQYLNTSAL